MKELVIGVSVSLAALVAALAIGLCCNYSQPQAVTECPKVAEQHSSYQDSCVTRVIEPEISLDFVRCEPLSEECLYLCYYLFRAYNQTYSEGTKAYKVTVTLQDNITAYLNLEGRQVQLITLHGLMSRLDPARFPELKQEGYFVVQAKCPKCLAKQESQVTFTVEFWDCKGLNTRSFSFNLSAF
ncbi:hypothetical protein B6D52_03710 [Candidatus Parcubacteria bacterium 4484_255]|nr:MAG: hypothetical protein B6D52_03710 [Candidatus Parcubacteria bacterium 4484_255]